MRSYVHSDVLTHIDTIIQMARCSFDVHLQNLVGTLIVGASVVLLRPRGNMDMSYLSHVLVDKQITVMDTVPSLLTSFFTFLKDNSLLAAVRWLRTLCNGGEH